MELKRIVGVLYGAMCRSASGAYSFWRGWADANDLLYRFECYNAGVEPDQRVSLLDVPDGVTSPNPPIQLQDVVNTIVHKYIEHGRPYAWAFRAQIFADQVGKENYGKGTPDSSKHN